MPYASVVNPSDFAVSEFDIGVDQLGLKPVLEMVSRMMGKFYWKG